MIATEQACASERIAVARGFWRRISDVILAQVQRRFDRRLLERMDDRMLKDMGLHRSAIASALMHADRRQR